VEDDGELRGEEGKGRK